MKKLNLIWIFGGIFIIAPLLLFYHIKSFYFVLTFFLLISMVFGFMLIIHAVIIEFFTRFRDIWYNFLALITITITLFIFTEAGLRIFFPFTPATIGNYYPRNMWMIDNDIGVRMKPNFKGLMEREEFVNHVETNSMGFRSPEINFTKRKGDIRIAFIGDSFTYGHGAEANETYPALLNVMLNKKFGNRVEIINAGQPAYDNMQEMTMLQKYVMPLHPDIVVQQFFFNDVPANPYPPTYTVINGYLTEDYTKPKNFYFESWLLLKIYLDGIKRKINPHSVVPKQVREKTLQLYLNSGDSEINYQWNITENILKSTIKIIGNNSYYLINVPAIELTDMNEQEKQVYNKNNMLKKISQRESINFIDMEITIQKYSNPKEFYHAYDHHFNAQGYKIMAEIIYPILEKDIQKRILT